MSLAEKVEQELTCAICLARYSDPKVLPCLHLYCKRCLDGLKKEGSSDEKKHIACPQCKELHELPENGVDGFKTYFTINNLLELLHIHETNPNGDSAESQGSRIVLLCESELDPEDERRPAFARCLTCAYYLCKECLVLHKKQKGLKDHEIVTLEEIKLKERQAGIKILRKEQYCPEHEGEVVKLFCKKCKKAICRDCALVKHREHECEFVRELCPKVQEKLEKLVTVVQGKDKEFKGHREYIRNLRKLNQQSLISCTQEVEEAYQKMMEKLQSHRTVLLAEIQGIHDLESKQIDSEESSLALANVRFENSIRFTRQLLDNGDDVEVMSMSVQTQETLESLGKMMWDRETLKPIVLQVKFDPDVTNLKPFAKILHKIQPDAIIVNGFPFNVDEGKQVSFQVRLSPKMSYKATEDELTATATLDTHSVPVVVEATNETNSWSVYFVPDIYGIYQITITVANTTKVLPLRVYQPDPNYSYVEVKPKRKSEGDIWPSSAINSPLCAQQNPWRNSVPLPSSYDPGIQSSETVSLPSELLTSPEPDSHESRDLSSPVDTEQAELRSLPIELGRSPHTYTSKGKKRLVSKLLDSPRLKRYNVGGANQRPKEYKNTNKKQ